MAVPSNAVDVPVTFEPLMEKVLVGLPLLVCLVYLDNILVPACSFDDHIQPFLSCFPSLVCTLVTM